MSENLGNRLGTSTGISRNDLSLMLLSCSVTISRMVNELQTTANKLATCAEQMEMFSNLIGTQFSECSPTAKTETASGTSGQTDTMGIASRKLRQSLSEPENSAQRPARNSPLSTRLAALVALSKEKSLAQLNWGDIEHHLLLTYPAMDYQELLKETKIIIDMIKQISAK